MKKKIGIWGIVLLVLLAGCGSNKAITGLTSVEGAADMKGGATENLVYSSSDRNKETVRLHVSERKTKKKSYVKPKEKADKEKAIRKETKKKQYLKMKIAVGDKTFQVKLKDNKTTQALLKKLPITVSMGDLNQNEKYYYLPDSLPTDSKRVSQIQAGDIMLYGSECLVLFYQNFNTSYSYTSIGQIENTDTLTQTLGRGKVTVAFLAEEGGI